MNKLFLNLLVALAIIPLVGCGSGGGGEGTDVRDLGEYQNLRNFISETHFFAEKSEFETQAEFERRTDEYAGTLTGYYKTGQLNAEYDAESQELRVSFIGSGLITNGNAQGPIISFSHRGWPYDGHRASRTEGNETRNYYVILRMSGAEAQEIIDHFFADYTFAFNGEDVRRMGEGDGKSGRGEIVTYRIYNLKTGEEYP